MGFVLLPAATRSETVGLLALAYLKSLTGAQGRSLSSFWGPPRLCSCSGRSHLAQAAAVVSPGQSLLEMSGR